MNTNSHIQHGLWRHPAAQQADFNDVRLWIDLAKTLERGHFDAMFFADVVGLYGPVNGSYEVNAREGLQIPSNDPAVLLSALAVNTEHLGLAFTSAVLQEHPFDFARKVSTLDHISNGRIGWNVVTSSLENAARNFGFDRLMEHDERYRWAQEYMDVVYKLWEGSWDDGALLKDKVSGVYADHTKIHKINHVGEYYQVEGPHLPSPTLQRTPVIFQAGSSPAGRAFAARNAEAQFILAPTPEIARTTIDETRALVVEGGRRPDDLQFFQGLTFVIGSTEEEAKRNEAEIDEYISTDGFLAHINLGLDQATGTPLDPDMPLKDIKHEGGQSHTAWLRATMTDREPTIRDLAKITARIRGRFVGTPEQIADHLAVWQQAGVDGINVMNWTIPQSYELFIDEVMPVLRARGLAKQESAPGTLRQKLFGRDQLSESHYGRQYRGAFGDRS
ncbi:MULTISPECIES: LLM class flavin-dependent oxidoreductase [Subtercola]|uniref:LLM class flavin-dependent oxidoreductase n=1 Tax=Subtercola vilae TaxID=2056433 RepID=A0A4T2BIH8_9MICO|nr:MULTISPECIES: LLM class flavin-dependent oxidoreductase [Subtercola]MEA9987186.1 LLM class flavin-dependent oxidoreductase [Subtercola sp. RTI3]TIH30222.1 LLM class flavin-dependent oxidoreductase [Subtercola vilae]